jgi:hypothetical protein
MIAKRTLIKRFLNHKGVNKAWVAEKLYGKRDSTNTSKLRKKSMGIDGRHFTDSEVNKLDQIRKEFISDLI